MGVDDTVAMLVSGPVLQTGPACHNPHLVEFYETEQFLVDTVSALLAPVLGDGDAAIVVATTGHRYRFEAALGEAGIDVAAATRAGRYLAFDTATVLSRFMVGGAPDVTLFRETVGAIMDSASQGGRRIAVYGEMVALLWADGDVASALALEDLWNDFARIRTFTLLCAYPMRAFADEASTAPFKRVCDQHTTVIPSEGYSLLADPAEQSRAIAQLQQQAATRQPGVSPPRAPEVGDHAADQRDEAGVTRDRAGDERDQAADQRDQAADQRDRAADQRDRAAERSEASATTGDTTDSFNRSAVARRAAAYDRRRASQDRRAGASERTEGELDRGTALADRGASAGERANSSHDHLTGAYLRGPGFRELEREMARARRRQESLVVVFADVDGLKAVNDSRGHAAGDHLLRQVADTLGGMLRSHDLIIRYGGDEFVCAISGLNAAEATKRLALVSAALAEAPEHATVTAGLVELLPDEPAERLVARADAALYEERRRRRSASAIDVAGRSPA